MAQTKYIFQNYVHVHDGDGGVHVFYPGDEAPNWVINMGAADMAHFQSSDDPVQVEEIQVIDYSRLSKQELSDLCAERGLDFTGTKAELAQRLADADGSLD